MKRLVLSLMLFVMTSHINGQVIKGIVIDQYNSPVENVAVIMQTTDSVFVDAICSDSLGHFSLNSELNEFRLITQHLMYETEECVFSNTNEITIHLKEKNNVVEEVVVMGERQTMKILDGKISYNMPLLLEGKVVSNVYDAILQLPGVREQNDLLILPGTTGVTILVNGQMTSMPTANLIAALKMVPYDQIQSAEIMYSTPPQYHIKGAAINIVLKGGNANEGLQGQVNTAYTQKHYANYNAGATILYSTRKLSADLNYSYNLNHTNNGVDIFSNHLYEGNIHKIEQFNRGNRKANEHNIRLGLDYKLTEKDKLGLVYNSQLTTGMDKNEYSDGTFSNSYNHKEELKPIQMHNILLNYSSGFGLKTGIEFTSFNDKNNQAFIEKKKGKEYSFDAVSKQKINRYRFYVDQSSSIKTWTFNYGVQYMFASDHSSQRYHTLTGIDMSSSNMDNTLKEYTGNIYLGFEKTFGDRLSLSASFSGEYYNLGDFNEWTLFPAMEATYSISPIHMLMFSLSSDKVYPNYWELHGGTSYLNGYAELQGNPLLKPYREYSGQLSYILKSKYIITGYYNYMKDFSYQLPYQSSERLALIYQTLNFDYKQVVGMNIILPFQVNKILDTRLTLNGFYDKVKSREFHDISFKNDNIVFYSQLDNAINVSSKPNIKIELAGSYITKNIQGPADLSSLWKVDAGVKWSFWNNMAELRLKGTDLFNTWVPDMVMKYNNQDLKMNIIPDSRAILISFTLKLGDFKPSYKNIDASRFGTK